MPGEPILIVDDTPVNLKLTRILLVNEGYKVLTAASAEEALELLRSYHPYLVLADIQLPGIDGLEFTRRVKSDPATRDIMVVALTAFAMKGDEQKAVEAGCDGYITKPIDTRSLGARIREYLARRAESHPVTAAFARGRRCRAGKNHSARGRIPGPSPPLSGGRARALAPTPAGSGRPVQFRRCRAHGPSMDRYRRSSRLLRHQPACPRSGGRDAGTAAGQLRVAGSPHQPGARILQPARGARRSHSRIDHSESLRQTHRDRRFSR